jgi:hypothetical protein
VLGDGQPLSLEVHAKGGGEPEFEVRASPAAVVNLLRPPRARTWAEAIRRRPIPGSELLGRLLGSRLRLVRADQFQTFLANPDADRRSRAVYDYKRVGSTVPKSVVRPETGGDGNVLLVVLVLVGSVVALGGGLVAWARS